MNQEQQAFSAEIAKTIKDWTAKADELKLDYVASVSLHDSEGELKGIEFQQAVSAKPSVIVQGALATINEIPTLYKIKYMNAFRNVLTEFNESVEIRFQEQLQDQ